MKFPGLDKPRNLVIAAIIVVSLLYLIVVVPVQLHYRSVFLKLNPAEVSEITLEMKYRVNASVPSGKVVLSESERADFLKLLADSHLAFLNHPRGLWVCSATVVAGNGKFELLIHETSNNGTYIPLYSHGAGGSHVGDFRCNGLGQFIVQILERAQPSTPDAPAGAK